MPTKYLIIKGKVQGVFYRATAKEKAEEIGLTGWVRNTEAGDVEAEVTGSESQLKMFIDWCHQGPPRAKVTNVAVKDIEDKVFSEFKVIRG